MLSVHKTTVFFFKSTSKYEKQLRGTGTGRQFVLTARTKTIEKTGTGRQFPPSLASLSATKFSLQIYVELTELMRSRTNPRWRTAHCIQLKYFISNLFPKHRVSHFFIIHSIQVSVLRCDVNDIKLE